MKLHDLRPAEGANTPRTRVGRGIAAGKGKTAGRGTKGQKARAGGSIPPWFEGGQTPLHMRIPKLRGFKNRGRLVYEIVNVGDIAARIEAGAFAEAGTAPKKGEQLTINADILRAVGLVRDVKKPLKILGNGELATALFVVADAFTKSATAKIEGAGGAVSILEVPAESRPALGVGEAGERTARVPRTAAGRAAADQESTARARRDADTAEAAEETARASAASAAKAEKAEAANAQKADKAEKAPRAAKTPKGETAPADVADAVDSVEPEAAASPVDTADAVDSDADAASQAGAEIPAEAADSTESAGSTGAESDSAGDDLPAEAADALDDDATTASSDESA